MNESRLDFVGAIGPLYGQDTLPHHTHAIIFGDGAIAQVSQTISWLDLSSISGIGAGLMGGGKVKAHYRA